MYRLIYPCIYDNILIIFKRGIPHLWPEPVSEK